MTKQDTITELVRNLYKKEYSFVHSNVSVSSNQSRLELDVLAFNPKMQVRVFHVEDKFSNYNYNEACRKYSKFKDAYGVIKLRGIYVSNDCVKRLKYV